MNLAASAKREVVSRIRGAARRPSLRTVARRTGARRALKGLAGVLGFDLVKRSFYSPIPDWRSLPEEVWSSPSCLRGIEWDLERQLEFFEQDLGPYVAEFSQASGPGAGTAYHYDNGFFGAVDADVLYAAIRHFRPRRILELGSGYSSLIIGTARARNAAEGAPSQHDVYDPFCRRALAPAIRSSAALHLLSATDVPLSEFDALQAGDVLFVDTTHTVKLGSDVNFVVLDVLPALRPGVVVHFHDIFLPHEYPKSWLVDPEVYWAEQYLLQAFLACNKDFEILFGSAAALSAARDRVHRVVPATHLASGASSMWLRRRS